MLCWENDVYTLTLDEDGESLNIHNKYGSMYGGWYLMCKLGENTDISNKYIYNNITTKDVRKGTLGTHIFLACSDKESGFKDYEYFSNQVKILNNVSAQLPVFTKKYVYLFIEVLSSFNSNNDTEVTGSVTIYGGRVNLQDNKNATPSETTQVIEADSGYAGLKRVSVLPIPSEYIIPTGSETITENGTYDISDKEEVVVDIDIPTPTYQTKTVTPSESTQTITPDTGYDGLSSVEVSAIMIDGLTVAQIREKLQAIVEGDM